MKLVVQRVKSTRLEVDGKLVSEIGKGLAVYVGVAVGDSEKDADRLAEKLVKLRIFEDENGKMNLSLLDKAGEVLCISQFTLAADTKKGNRPSFVKAMEPETASKYYDLYCEKLKEYGIKRVEKGIFGADMSVSLINDGPVTIILDTDTWKKH
ncbi:MAG TPA: D-tyrosyl-tRNA(Tyr) deacylase [Clostridiales bacterium]|nr:D-tyrosyl-tRNA(Tyr) deacylase [Clostridiales bacterium]